MIGKKSTAPLCLCSLCCPYLHSDNNDKNDYRNAEIFEFVKKGKLIMKNNLNDNQKTRVIRRIILCIILSLLFVLSVNGILCTIGVINTKKDIIIALLASSVFVYVVVGAILLCVRIMNNEK